MNPLLAPLDRPDFIPIRNRTTMSAMSRSQARNNLPTEQMRDYYRRRADGGVGLILTEGTIIHSSGDGWNGAPYMATDEQADSWRAVTDSVHEAGAAIACQLWHLGRISHADYTGSAPISSTAIAAAGINRQNGKPYGVPRPLRAEEMPEVYGYYAAAARRALRVGFDAVELHCGHGYLPDQFLDGSVNDRTDAYGGSIQNRCRFVVELVRAVLAAVPSERLIIRISPSRAMNGIHDWPDLEEMISYLMPQLQREGLRALDVSCANSPYAATASRVVRMIRPLWDGILLGGASLSAEEAATEVREGWLDLVTWGRAFIANPDLTDRIARGAEWAPFEETMRDTLY